MEIDSTRAGQARHEAPENFTLVVSEGANFTAAVMSKRFAAELAHTLNETVNAERCAATRV